MRLIAFVDFVCPIDVFFISSDDIFACFMRQRQRLPKFSVERNAEMSSGRLHRFHGKRENCEEFGGRASQNPILIAFICDQPNELDDHQIRNKMRQEQQQRGKNPNQMQCTGIRVI